MDYSKLKEELEMQGNSFKPEETVLRSFKSKYCRQGYISFKVGKCEITGKENVPVFYIDGSEQEYSSLWISLEGIQNLFEEYSTIKESQKIYRKIYE